MISSDLNTYQSQTSDDAQELSTFTSRIPGNGVRPHAETIVVQAIPPPLAAPPGWRSEIVHSDIPITADNRTNLVITNNTYKNSYRVLNTTNTFANSQADQPSSTTNTNADNAYLNTESDTNAVYQNQSELTEQQQQSIINTVERQQPPPVVVRRTLPNNVVTYRQNVSIRYLQPPALPPAGPLIIREVRPPPPPPQSPIQIRQRPPPVPTPPPLVLRERPPPVPPRSTARVVEKLLPPPPAAPRQIVVERYGPCPPKPSDVIIERWLPYKQSGQQRVLLERATAPYISPQEPNLLVIHEPPRARICKEFINEGVIRADPECYIQRYGAELNLWQKRPEDAYLVGEASRAVPPPFSSFSDRPYRQSYNDYCLDGYQRASSPYVSANTWDSARMSSPVHRSSSIHFGSSPYDYCTQSSSRYGYDSGRYVDDYCNQSSSRYGYDPHRSSNDYSTRQGSYLTMTDVTSSWNRHCGSSPHQDYPSSQYPPVLPYSSSFSSPNQTIRVNSDNEFRRIICDLTNGHVPVPLRSY